MDSFFYANIVRANQATFFPPNTTNSFLSWFIAWINLDIDIETCFYSGLNAYVKTWLQFIFPLYIWSIALLIIVLSHYFKTAPSLSSKNAVQVLATLFLLSYAKLLRIFITVFSFTVVTYPSRSEKVWLYDGNVAYLQGKHITLFMAAMVVLLVISVPYTGALLFIQCFRRLSNHKLLSWIHKLKPFFDAYIGPYKDRHHYWTGMLLLVRARPSLNPFHFGENLLSCYICCWATYSHMDVWAIYKTPLKPHPQGNSANVKYTCT